MNPRMLLSLALATLSLMFASGCAQDAKKKSPETYSVETQAEVNGRYFRTFEFDPGSSHLKFKDRVKIMSFLSTLPTPDRKIHEIKILSWSDSEYPAPGAETPKRAVELAEARARAIEDFLREEAVNHRIVSFNMARRPGKVARSLRTKEYQIKDSVQDLGLTATLTNDGELSYTKASRAFVIVDFLK